MNKALLLILFFCLKISAFSQDNRFVPIGGNVDIVEHKNYLLGYSEQFEQALWVSYELLSSELYGSTSRTNNFRIDPLVSTGSAELSDYKGSGYDRGHLAPAADMAFSYEAMSESFFMSNMALQLPSFNRGVWKDLESQIRRWAVDHSPLYVVTGPIIMNSEHETIGSNGVVVPDGFYKALLHDGESIGFILKHENGLKNILMDYVVSIDQLEQITGLDFFVELDDDLESKSEQTFSIKYWSTTTQKSGVKSQCLGTAKSTGKRCKIYTTNTNQYCQYHQSQFKNE